MASILLLLFWLFEHNPFQVHNPDSMVVTQWTIRDGLPLNSTSQVVQDADGFIWISTYDGLVRFDGRRFDTFVQANEPAIRNNRLDILHVSEMGCLWIGQESQGLIQYKDGVFRYFGEEEGLTMEPVTEIVSIPGGVMVGTYDGLYRYRFDTDRFERIDLGTDPNTNNIVHIFADRAGAQWVSTLNGVFMIRDADVRRLDQGRYVSAHADAAGRIWLAKESGLRMADAAGSMGLPTRLPTWIAQTPIFGMASLGADLVISTPRGYHRLADNRLFPLELPQGQQAEEILKTLTDQAGNRWMVTQSRRLYRLDGERLVEPPQFSEIRRSGALHLFEDRERNLWVSTERGGLFRIKSNRISHIGKLEGLAGENILGLMVSDSGRLFIGQRATGWATWDGATLESFVLPNVKARGVVQTFHQDRSGRIWMGTFQNSLYRLDRTGRATPVPVGNSVQTRDIRAIADGADGILWLGTSGGLVAYHPETGERRLYTRESGLPSQTIRHIRTAPDGRLWVSTNDAGIFRFDPATGAIEHLHRGNGFPADIIRTVFVDPDDPETIWVGSETHGLIRWRAGQARYADRQSGLPDHIVHEIVQDRFGWLWISTNRGVVRILKSGLNEYFDGRAPGFQFVVYSESDGLRNAEANGSVKGTLILTPDGHTVLVATQAGVAMIPVDQPDDRAPAPPVYLRDGMRYREQLTIRRDGDERFVDVSFAALRYDSPYRIRTQYRVLGSDDGWTDIYQENRVSLQDLPFGTTRVEIVAWNEAGTRVSDPALLIVRVVPFFWQTVWFWGAFFLAVGGGVWAIIQYRTTRFEILRRRLELLVDERTLALSAEKAEVEKQKAIIEEQAAVLQELNQTKDRFFSIIGHDLRGPFQSLVGLTQLVIEDYETMDDAEIQQHLRHLKQSSETLHRLVENLLEWSALQKGKVKPLIEDIDLNHIAQATVRMFGPGASVKGIHFEALVPDSFRVKADRNIVETVIRNFVSNAIKYTKVEGVVVLEAGMDESEWWIQVSDNGIGMSDKLRLQLMKIDRGVKRRGTMNESGTGLGLVLCKELMNLHGGSILVESEEGVGSRFTARFPIHSGI